jgi:hypothetical protein
VALGDDSRAENAESRDLLVSASSLDVNLRQELHQMGAVDEQSNMIDSSMVEKALWEIVHRQSRKIPIGDFDPKMADAFKELDANKDGFMDYKEIEEAVLLMLKRKKQNRRLIFLVIIMFICSMMFLAAIFGLVFVVVDMHKDMKATGGYLVSRVDGSTIKVGSSDFIIQDGALLQAASPYSSSNIASSVASPLPPGGPGTTTRRAGDTNSSLLDNSDSSMIPESPTAPFGESNPVESPQSLKTTKQRYAMDTISSDWPNEAFQSMSHLTLTTTPNDAHGLLLHAEVNGAIRLPKNLSEPGNGTVVLLLTAAGRFVVSGTDVQAASGALAQMDAKELLGTVQSAAAQQQRNGRRSPTRKCEKQKSSNVVPGGPGGRRDDVLDCEGQQFACTMETYPFKCDRGNYCPTASTSFRCSSLLFQNLPNGGDYASCRYDWCNQGALAPLQHYCCSAFQKCERG